jgi:hypothetical protein
LVHQRFQFAFWLAISWYRRESIEGFDAILEEEEEEREHMLKFVLRFGSCEQAAGSWFLVVSRRREEEESEHEFSLV